MTHTIIRTALVTAAVDAAVLAGVWACTKLEDAKFARRQQQREQAGAAATPQLTAEERAELAQLNLAAHGQAFPPDYFPAQAAYLEATAEFRPDLLAGPDTPLTHLPLTDLIGEITHAKALLRASREYRASSTYGTPADRNETEAEIATWDRQLTALKAEFDRRDEHRFDMPELDRARMDVASRGVHSSRDEWPRSWASISAPAPATDDVGTVHEPAAPVASTEADALDAQARELEKVLFGLHDQDNTPDIVWTEDGPEYAATFHDAEDPALAEALGKAETKLDEFLAANRQLLGGRASWQSYYDAMDRQAENAENTENTEDGQ